MSWFSSIVFFWMHDLVCGWNVILKLFLIEEIWSTDPDYNEQPKQHTLTHSLSFPLFRNNPRWISYHNCFMSDGWNTHAEAGARVPTAAWLHKLTFASVFLNGELRNFPFSLVHNHGSSEQLTGRCPGVEVKKGVTWFSLDRRGVSAQQPCQIWHLF